MAVLRCVYNPEVIDELAELFPGEIELLVALRQGDFGAYDQLSALYKRVGELFLRVAEASLPVRSEPAQ